MINASMDSCSSAIHDARFRWGLSPYSQVCMRRKICQCIGSNIAAIGRRILTPGAMNMRTGLLTKQMKDLRREYNMTYRQFRDVADHCFRKYCVLTKELPEKEFNMFSRLVLKHRTIAEATSDYNETKIRNGLSSSETKPLYLIHYCSALRLKNEIKQSSAALAPTEAASLQASSSSRSLSSNNVSKDSVACPEKSVMSAIDQQLQENIVALKNEKLVFGDLNPATGLSEHQFRAFQFKQKYNLSKRNAAQLVGKR